MDIESKVKQSEVKVDQSSKMEVKTVKLYQWCVPLLVLKSDDMTKPATARMVPFRFHLHKLASILVSKMIGLSSKA